MGNVKNLNECSTEELADLVLEYPFLIDIFAFDNPERWLERVTESNNVFQEYMLRDDSRSVLLKKYKKLNVDYAIISNKTGNRSQVLTNSGYMKEVFFQTYFAVNSNFFNNEERKELKEIIERNYLEKKAVNSNYSGGILFYDHLQKINGSIPSDLVAESILDKFVDSDLTSSSRAGYSPSNNFGTNFNTAYVNIGTYTKYNETVGCYKYISGDVRDEDKDEIDEAFQAAHPTWTFDLTMSRRYNCHSYAWISASSYNIYWLNNPDKFSNSSSFTKVGTNCSLLKGDKVVLEDGVSHLDGFGNTTYSLHSLIVTSSGGRDAMTKSKLGSQGVYIASLEDMIALYGAFCYMGYR